MSRSLVAGLLAEGETDELFLGMIMSRQLRALTERSNRCAVDVANTAIGGCRTILDLDRVAAATAELARDCHLVCLHNDHKERDKAEKVAARCAAGVPVVTVVPVRETEAWLLADPAAWGQLRGSDTRALPKRPRDVEKIADPKLVLDQVVQRRDRDRRDYFEFIGRNISLDVLAEVPAYADWVSKMTTALKELKYL
jgi:Domain of unknown function (DUF4276)